jgi:hypothetical protein
VYTAIAKHTYEVLAEGISTLFKYFNVVSCL